MCRAKGSEKFGQALVALKAGCEGRATGVSSDTIVAKVGLVSDNRKDSWAGRTSEVVKYLC